MRPKTADGILCLVVVTAILCAACTPSSPIERVAEARSFYTATLNGFYATPIVPEPEEGEAEEGEEGADDATEEADDAAEGAGAEEAAEEPSDETVVGDDATLEGEEGEPTEALVPEGPVLSDLVLDVVVRHDSPTRLDGLTLDVTMEDPSGVEKERWLWWIDTSNLPKGSQAQHTRTFEAVEYEEGDRLAVEVRHPVPEGERGDYREFDVAE